MEGWEYKGEEVKEKESWVEEGEMEIERKKKEIEERFGVSFFI